MVDDRLKSKEELLNELNRFIVTGFHRLVDEIDESVIFEVRCVKPDKNDN
ncbi:MAG: hypothetical protein V1735_07245 [Nanoarchaeota archaeon]